MKPRRSPLERFKRRSTGHVTAWRRGASGHCCRFPQWIDGARGADADTSRVCRDPALISAPSSTCFHPCPSRRCVLDCASRPSPTSATRSTPFDPAVAHLDCLFVPCYGSLSGVGCPQARWRRQRGQHLVVHSFVLAARRGHLRGHARGCGGGSVVLTTFLMIPSYLSTCLHCGLMCVVGSQAQGKVAVASVDTS